MTIEYTGGYFLLAEPLVRGYGYNAHSSDDMSQLSEYTVESVNLIQETPWKVNSFILETVKRLFELEKNVTVRTKSGQEVILMIEEPHDPRKPRMELVNGEYAPVVDPRFQNMTKDEWNALDPKIRKEKSTARAKALKQFEEDYGTYRATLRVFASAEEMSQHDKFYFPHNMDFRLRIYPIPSDLNPQSSDFSKGFLAFSRGTRLGEAGLYWLASSVADAYGEDKLHHSQKVEFTNSGEFALQLRQWVDDPVEHRGWLEADKPFQFLALAHEWVWANRIPEPASFISYLPGHQDGTCNGAQHLSILSRDLIGAEATNCRSIPDRKDLYMEVGDKVYEKLLKGQQDGDPWANHWIAKMTDPSERRKIVKRSVMTVPYGVTKFGIADFMMEEHIDSGEDDRWDKSTYIRDLIWKAIKESIMRGTELQAYFSMCAAMVAEAGKPLQWETPAGSKVTQAYRSLIQKRVRTANTRFYVYEEPKPDEDDEDFLNRIGFDIKKSATAAPPNVIHSCDAAHLQITVCRMADAGIRDFSMIHDSFGCPMAYVGLMRDVLRQSIVDMYEDNYLVKWKESVEEFTGVELPEPPELGEFDINEILESEFFFS